VIHRSVKEWESVTVSDGGDERAISRRTADSLIAAAQASRIGGADGEKILINGYRRLIARQVVGVLAAPGATLEILPKIDGLDDGSTRRCLVHMLARVFDLDIASGAMAALDWQSHDLLEIIISLFCDQLIEAVRRGLPRRYKPEEADRAVLRGRLDVQRQFTVLAARPQKLACRYDELSADIPLNQIMRAAVTRLGFLTRASENQRRLTELAFAFDELSSIPVNQLPWDLVVLDRTNAMWASLLRFVELLLGRRFQTTSSGVETGYSLLFEMNTLFEQYIGRTLRSALADKGLEVRLQGPRDHVLSSGNDQHFVTRPDIVVSQRGNPVFIIDTKWKRLNSAIDDPKHGIAQSDIYQMVAYAQVYRCDRVMLLYPHHTELGVDEGIIRTFAIRGTKHAQLFVATVSVFHLADFKARVGKLVLGPLRPPLGQWTSAAA
jgi:5-methylcytosine-specific restriction enzyme subunit McrC